MVPTKLSPPQRYPGVLQGTYGKTGKEKGERKGISGKVIPSFNSAQGHDTGKAPDFEFPFLELVTLHGYFYNASIRVKIFS